MSTALYPGSFDPVHNGHLAVITHVAALFDQVIIGVGHNPDKPSGLFSPVDRVAMIRQGRLDEIRDQFYDSVAQLFLRYAKESRRALLVLEDVEWMDDASRLVLARMAIHLRDSPVMVLLTASSEEGAAAALLTARLDEPGAYGRVLRGPSAVRA